MTSCNHPQRTTISGEHFFCESCKAVFCNSSTGLALNHNDVNVMIDIFASRQQAWFTEPINALLQSDQEIAALAVIAAYFEGIQHFVDGHPDPYEEKKNGKKKSYTGRKFKEAAAEVLGLSSSDCLIEELYKTVRNSLFHTGMLYSKVKLGQDLGLGSAIMKDGQYTLIDVKVLHEAVQRHFAAYVSNLRNGSGRAEFKKCWTTHWIDS